MNTLKGYELAKEQYAALGVDVDKAIEAMDNVPVSVHCWQCDDVNGFENMDGGLTGGIQTTGNHPGKATNPDELRADLDKALSYIPGLKKVNIHASYLEGKADRNEIEPEHFKGWADWACDNKYGLDFNPTCFSHPKAADNFTLSHKDKEIRDFWIEHCIRSRKVAEYLGERTGMTCVTNIWVPDGEKEFPIDSYGPRKNLKDSLDKVMNADVGTKNHLCSVECKLFGIGSESYVVGSHEFYMGYALSRNDLALTLDVGHFHPTELVSNKLSAMLLYLDKILLHVSRGVRWDSDHVVAFDDETRLIMRELVRLNALDKVYIATDYFDASINRVMALAIGARNTKKAVLEALLQPVDTLKAYEKDGELGQRLALSEELKAMPLDLVWNYYCEKHGVLTGMDWIKDADKYEKEVLLKR